MTRSINEEFPLEHHYADVNRTRLHYIRTGSGPLIVFLHGFPQGWFIYRRQLQEFARDHTVVSVDLRGYNLSDKPTASRDYGSWILAEDTRELVELLGFDTFTLVGHDTGGAAGYALALHYPQLLDHLVILTTPHPALFDRELHDNQAQIAASQYLLTLRQPAAIPMLKQDGFRLLRAMLEAHEFFREDDVDEHVDAWRQPGAVDGMLGWYRYEGLGPADDAGTPGRGNYVPEVSPLIIKTPSLVIYAEKDVFVLPACFRGLAEYMPALTLHEVKGASHWLLNEHPQLVNRLIRQFIADTPASDHPIADRPVADPAL